jgi:hypothetical protein
MPTTANTLLVLAAGCDGAAAVLHCAIVANGPVWYRFFGASPKLVAAADAGHYAPTLVTMGIAAILAIWTAYALAGSGVISPLPLTKAALIAISAIYIARGIVGFALIGTVRHVSPSFIIVSSMICLAIGALHALGLAQRWQEI